MEILSSRRTYITVYEVVSSMNDACMTGKCSLTRNEKCEYTPNRNEPCNRFSACDETCGCSPTWDENRMTCKYSPTWDETRMTCKYSPTWDENRMTCKYSPTWDETRMTCKYSPTWDETRMTCKYSPRWDGIFSMIHYESDFAESIFLLYDICKTYGHSQRWNVNSCEVYEENELFDFILTPKQKRLTCNLSREMCNIGEFKCKMPLFRYFRYLHSCSIFLTISKCRILSYSFYRNLMKKHDYKTRWLQLYLIYIFVSVVNCYSTWIDLRKRRRIERRRKSQKKKIYC
jgi:hypothetical protein